MGFHSSEKEDLQKFVPQHKMGIKVLDESQLLNIFPTYQNLLDKIETYRHAINSLNTETLREERYQYNLMYDNVFSILGKRGTGKTSAVFSLKHLIENDERYPNDRVFPIIMPEVIQENGNILGWIVALLSDTVDEIERKIKKSSRVSDDGDFFKNCLFVENNSLRNSLKEIRELCFSQKYNPKQESSFYEAIGNAAQQAQNSYSFAKAITGFWTALINAILKMNGQSSYSSIDQVPLIYFIFDDVDLSPDKVEHLMSIITKYLSHPNVIVIVTADEDLFLEVIENSIDRKIGREKKDIRQILEKYMEMTLYYGTFMDSPLQRGKANQISDTARLYLGKVLPPSSRYYLELYYDSDRKRNFQIYHDKNLEMGLSGNINKFLGVDEKSKNNFLYYNENFIEFYMEFFGNTARQISNEFFIIDDLIDNLIKIRTDYLNNKQLSFQYQYQVYNHIRHFVYSSINANHGISDMVADMNHLVDNLLLREYNNWFIFINYSYLNSNFIDMCQNIEDEEEIKIYLKQVIALYSLMFFTENILVLLDRVPIEGNMIPRTKVHGTNELSEYINQNVFSGYSGDYWEWSGIDITLPKKYEVKRWWNTSGYDLFLEGKEKTLSAMSPKQIATSNIMISPNSDDTGDKITIHSDISFTSNAVKEQANKETINQWGDRIAKFAPSSLVRCEGASFDTGTDLESALLYYRDFLEMCKKNKLGWLVRSTSGLLNHAP